MVKRTVLFLASTPTDSSEVRSTKEYSTLKAVFTNAALQSSYHFEPEFNVTPKKFIKYLRKFNPWLVHFCGHGVSGKGILLEDEASKKTTLNSTNLIIQMQNNANIKGVFLNACYSSKLADDFINVVDFFIGIDGEIDDDTAIEFASTFYNLFEDYENIWFAMKQVTNDLMAIKSKAFKPVFRWNKFKTMKQAEMDVKNYLAIKEKELKRLGKQVNDLESQMTTLENNHTTLFERLMEDHPYPQIVFWFKQERELLALNLAKKCLSGDSDRKIKRFGRELLVMFDLFEVVLVNFDLRDYTKEEIEEFINPDFDINTYRRAFNLLPDIPKIFTPTSIEFLRDSSKYFSRFLI